MMSHEAWLLRAGRGGSQSASTQPGLELLLGNLFLGLVSLRGGSLPRGLVLLVGAGFGHPPVSFLGSLAVAFGSFLL